MYKGLFGEEMDQSLSGSEVFSKYFSSRINEIIKVINKEEDEEVVEYYLKILFYLHKIDPKSFSISSINQVKIQKQGLLPQQCYLFAIHMRLGNYLPLVEDLLSKFDNSSNQHKVRASFILLSTPEYENYLPEKLIDLAIQTITDNLESMSIETLVEVVKNVYPVRNETSKAFVEKLTSFYLENDNKFEEKVIPLVRKLMKLRDRMKLPNGVIRKYILENPFKFETIFKERSLNSMLYLEIALGGKKFLPEEVRSQFNSYIGQYFKETGQLEEIDLEQL